MATDIAIGIVALALALGTLTGLVLWCRRIIDRIASSGSKTTREMLKELHGER